MKLLTICVAGGIGLGVALLSWAGEQHNHSHSDGYQKPGAPVTFEHNYDGKTALAESESVQLQIVPTNDLEMLTIELESNNDALQLEGEGYIGPAVSGEPIVMPVSIKSNDPGRFYVSVFITGQQGSLTRTRSFALPINVGDYQRAKSVVAKVDGEQVKVLQALETVQPN
jgi:hypothetical protein